jgi:hypothetical protein
MPTGSLKLEEVGRGCLRTKKPKWHGHADDHPRSVKATDESLEARTDNSLALTHSIIATPLYRYRVRTRHSALDSQSSGESSITTPVLGRCLSTSLRHGQNAGEIVKKHRVANEVLTSTLSLIVPLC